MQNSEQQLVFTIIRLRLACTILRHKMRFDWIDWPTVRYFSQWGLLLRHYPPHSTGNGDIPVIRCPDISRSMLQCLCVWYMYSQSAGCCQAFVLQPSESYSGGAV